MAALKEIASYNADRIRNGIAWVIVWKQGRSWHAKNVYLSTYDDTFEGEDLDKVHEILEQDPNAVMVNGYYCGHFGEDMTVEEIAAGIRWHYENGYNLLQDSTAFPPERMERPADLPADMPWSEHAATAEPDPYVYDGSMSVEDFTLMHEHMKADEWSERLSEAAEKMAEAFERVAKWATEVCQKVAAVLRDTASKIVDTLLYNFNDHPRWWYLYKHAKKARTRKKYRRRLMEQLQQKLRAAAITWEVIT